MSNQWSLSVIRDSEAMLQGFAISVVATLADWLICSLVSTSLRTSTLLPPQSWVRISCNIHYQQGIKETKIKENCLFYQEDIIFAQ